MDKTVSDTPRCDREKWLTYYWRWDSGEGICIELYAVPFDLAGLLERELNAAKVEIAELKNHLSPVASIRDHAAL